MLRYLLALLSFCALVYGDGESQPYCTYEYLGEKSRAFVREKLNFKEPTIFQKSYAALIFTLLRTGEIVSTGLDYDSAYNKTKMLHTLGDSSPELARDTLLKFMDDIEANLDPIKSWVHTNLASEKPEDLTSCDGKVSSLVQGDASSQKSAKVIMEVAKLTQLYLVKKDELANAAKSNTALMYLENTKNDLRPIILQVAVVYKILRS